MHGIQGRLTRGRLFDGMWRRRRRDVILCTVKLRTGQTPALGRRHSVHTCREPISPVCRASGQNDYLSQRCPLSQPLLSLQTRQQRSFGEQITDNGSLSQNHYYVTSLVPMKDLQAKHGKRSSHRCCPQGERARRCSTRGRRRIVAPGISQNHLSTLWRRHQSRLRSGHRR